MLPDEPVRLGRSGLTVSRLGLGTAWLGNLYRAVDDATAAQVVETSFDLGVRLVDTAPFYGLGLAEQRVGRALGGRPRGSFVLSTKVGRMLRPRRRDDPELLDRGRPLFVDAPTRHPYFDFSYDAALRSVDDSLTRLGLDRLDIALIHDPDDHFDEALDGAYRALTRLRDEGIVRAVGVGMNQPEMLVRFAHEGDFDCFLLAGHYTLLDQTGLTGLLPVCAERNIAVIIGGVFNTGFLAAPAPGAIYNYVPAPPGIVERAGRIEAVCRRHGVPLKAAALAFPFGHPAVASVLTGVSSAAELRENAALLRTTIDGALWEELRGEKLLPADAPTPG